jgi:hypothetical protein
MVSADIQYKLPVDGSQPSVRRPVRDGVFDKCKLGSSIQLRNSSSWCFLNGYSS